MHYENIIMKLNTLKRRGMVSEVPWKEPDNSNVNYIFVYFKCILSLQT